MAARLAYSLVDLRDEINAAWPKRDKLSDGWIGDPAHAARTSDHNPNSAGVVRAIDVDVDGVPAGKIVEHLRQFGARGDNRLKGGYLIFNSRIAGTHTSWGWRAYNGVNPHRSHFHVSAGDYARDYDARRSWNIASLKPAPPAPAPAPQEEDVARLITEDGHGIYATDGVGVYHVPSPGVLSALARTGIYGPLDSRGNAKVYRVPAGTLNSLRASEMGK